MSPADRAFVALADHCIGCPGCQPDLDAPDAPRPQCAEADRLYREWSQARRASAQ